MERCDAETDAAWHRAMTGAGLEGVVCWQVHLPPRHAAELVNALSGQEINWAMDWGGGRVWIATDSTDDAVRTAAAALGGDARLVRAPAEMRERIPAFQPRQPGVAMLEARVRRAFDPAGVFATTRFQEATDADQL